MFIKKQFRTATALATAAAVSAHGISAQPAQHTDCEIPPARCVPTAPEEHLELDSGATSTGVYHVMKFDWR